VPLTGQITRPGRTPRELARSGSRALSFDPQSKAEIAQGEYKGAREVLARHVHTAQRPAAGWPGGVLSKDLTANGRPSRVGCWMCSFDGIDDI
jgi:hypothetical protein